MRKSEIAVHQAHLPNGHCVSFAATEEQRDSTLYQWQMENALLPACLSDGSQQQLEILAADSWIRVPWVSGLSVRLISILHVGGTERWPMVRCRGESNGVMMWRLGATLPIPGMKRCCTESPRWSGGLFKKGRGPFAQTDTTLIFGQRRTGLNNKY